MGDAAWDDIFAFFLLLGGLEVGLTSVIIGVRKCKDGEG